MSIADKKYLEKKVNFHIFMLSIYGIGRYRRDVLSKSYGILGRVRMDLILSLLYKKVVRFLDENYVTERSLSRIVGGRLRRESKILSLKGWKLLNGLPINGQTSRPNGSTARRLGLDYHFYSQKLPKGIQGIEIGH